MGILVWLIVRLEVETLFIFPLEFGSPLHHLPALQFPHLLLKDWWYATAASDRPNNRIVRGVYCLYCCSLYHFGILFLSYLFHTCHFNTPPGLNTTCIIPIPLQCHVYCYNIILLAIMVDCCNMHQHYGTRFFEHSATNDDH